MPWQGNSVRELLGRFAGLEVLVVGDLMLDRYLFGTVDRISPEAPVPVVRVRSEKQVPGGASNVAWNVKALGAGASVGGVIGRDEAGATLRRLLEEAAVSPLALFESGSARTTIKTRVMAERQQALRVDWEDDLALTEAEWAAFLKNLDTAVRRASGVILEDYGKGVITQPVVDAVLRAATATGIPVGMDPKDNHELNTTGVTVITPNRKEAFHGAGVHDPGPVDDPLQDKKLRLVGDILLEKWAPKQLLITLGPQGMLLLAPDRTPRHVPTRAREVFDVSGAGDTVVAVCTLALAAGAGFREAAELANYAAGVVVGKMGTATCTPQELLAYMGL